MATGEIILTARHVSKKFAKTLRHNMLFGLKDLARSAFGLRASYGDLRPGEFWAVDNIDLELRRGQVLGLAGLNGCGKTTLIQLLAGIIPPNRGEIRCKGRISTIVSLGAGFNPLLTGRENIRVKAAMMGMSREEIEDKFDRIVAFADLGEFIDSPLTFYSSGMRVRLGFAVASSCDPDILLLDEVFAVGDRKFRHKCLDRMEEVMQRAGIIISAHETKKIARICNSMIIMEKGRKIFETDRIAKGIDFYNERYEMEAVTPRNQSACELRDLRITKPEGCSDPENAEIPFRGKLSFSVTLALDPIVRKAHGSISIYDQDANLVSYSSTAEYGLTIENSGAPVRMEIALPSILLIPGRYYLHLGLDDTETGESLFTIPRLLTLRVTGEAAKPSAVSLVMDWKMETV